MGINIWVYALPHDGALKLIAHQSI